MAAAVFEYGAWAARYPELALNVPPGLGAALFAEAGLYVAPGEGSVVPDVNARTAILYMLVAHLAAMAAFRAASASTGLVGRVASASEGSVSVTMAPMALPGGAEWYGQTEYGFGAWTALAQYRTMRYVPGPLARRKVGAYGAFPFVRGF